MLLIVGLGNPGQRYQRNRHNVGFMAADAIHRRHGFSPWRRRFHGEVSETELGGEKALILKPQTYMNESGRAVQEAVRFYKLDPASVVVIHDEVDLPPGKIRMKVGGGVAGHNGLRSIGAAIGDGFRRLRIGVGHPGVKEAVPNYVLHDFAKADGAWLAPLIDAIAEHAPLLAAGKDSTFANRLHEALGEAAPGKKKVKEDKPTGETVESKSADAAARPVAGDDKAAGPLARSLRRLFGR
ncbi:MAG: aminoacyl-tRNA hydrolase [Bauldia sp.]